MEKKQNPNSHSQESSWSELPQELLNLIFERLGFADFQRAKSVCASWNSSSRQSVSKNQTPWLILFPKIKNNSCFLFNPEEKHKIYEKKDLSLEFSWNEYIATYGSWFLMRDPRCNLYIVNLFNQDRIIQLPPVESQLGMIKVERNKYDFLVSKDHDNEVSHFSIQSPVFWIDEETKDYIVIWGLGKSSVVYSKNGDNSWKQIPESSGFSDLAYMDHKLYVFTEKDLFRIFNFSGEIPQQIFRHRFNMTTTLNHLFWPCETKLVVTVRGDVLRVVRDIDESRIFLHVYKVYSSESGSKEYERVDSWDDEARLLALGITVLANDNDGFNRNSIYLSGVCLVENTADLFLFNVEKPREMELLHRFDCSSIQLSSAQWFLPSLIRK